MEKEIKNLKQGETVCFPIISSIVPSEQSPMRDIEGIAERYRIPVEKLRYKREIFYFKSRGVKEEGWTDVAEVSYTK